MPLSFFDSHCHFDFSVFDSERESIWDDCCRNGIRHLLIPGVEPKQWDRPLAIASQLSGVVMSVGIHPFWLQEADVPLHTVWEQYIAHPHCVAIGECGLDAAIEAPMEHQIVVFEQHLQLAAEFSMPLIIHVRQAHNQTLQLLKKYTLPAGGVIHGFTGSKEMAMQYWRMGFYLGIGGSITYPRANKTRKMVQSMPLESLLLETDAPDMPLNGYQGQTNSPLRISDIAEELATLRHQTVAEIAQSTTRNSCQLFGI